MTSGIKNLPKYNDVLAIYSSEYLETLSVTLELTSSEDRTLLGALLEAQALLYISVSQWTDVRPSRAKQRKELNAFLSAAEEVSNKYNQLSVDSANRVQLSLIGFDQNPIFATKKIRAQQKAQKNLLEHAFEVMSQIAEARDHVMNLFEDDRTPRRKNAFTVWVHNIWRIYTQFSQDHRKQTTNPDTGEVSGDFVDFAWQCWEPINHVPRVKKTFAGRVKKVRPWVNTDQK